MSDLDSIFSDDWGAEHRSGLVAVVGQPNVGKSTLINAILDQKIAIATPKPQTTRRRQLGIHTTESAQILFVDTPGIHKPQNRLGDYMQAVARAALRDADAILWLLDAARAPNAADQRIADMLKQLALDAPLVLALNKIDLAADDADFTQHAALFEHHSLLRTCATKRQGIDELLDTLLPLLPLGPRLYPAEQASEANLRFLAAELIREKVIEHTSEEIPYAVAVEITRFKRGGAAHADRSQYHRGTRLAEGHHHRQTRRHDQAHRQRRAGRAASAPGKERAAGHARQGAAQLAQQ